METTPPQKPIPPLVNWINSIFDWIKFQKKLIVYFLPGQMAFSVTGNWTESAFLSWATPLASEWSKKREQSYDGCLSFFLRIRPLIKRLAKRKGYDYPPVEFANVRVLYFSPLQGELKQKASPESTNDGFTMIFADVTGIRSSDDLLDLMAFINSKRGETDPIASPNWLVNSNPQPGGTGGPGSWPVEAQIPQGDHWQFQLIDTQNIITPLPASNEDGEGVHIAILDTMPTQQAMQRAYEEWRWQHPLVNDVHKLSDRQIHIHHAVYKDLKETLDYRIIGHRYLMRDHGLFVAGIIHTLAPKATLHLYEVFNPYGIGSYESITTCLQKIHDDSSIGRPLIINCSFMLNIPVYGTRDPDFPSELRNSRDLAMIVSNYEEFFTLFTQQDQVTIIAAAGNDAKYNNTRPAGMRPHARYPAAFKNVVGVGALPKGFPTSEDERFKPASYSNLAYSDSTDENPERGYVTLGGEPGPGNGVLGMYICDYLPEPAGCLWRLWNILTLGRARYGRCYPPKFLWDFIRVKYKPNTTGWAWWAGTSFAAAIFSGSLASLYTSGNTSRNTSFNVSSVPSIMEGILQTEKSVDDENVLLIEQR